MKKLIPLLVTLLFISGGLAAQEQTTHRVLAHTPFTMAWTPGTDCENYEVEVSINNGEYIKLTEVSTTEIITQLDDEQKAIYRVRGFRDETSGRIVGPYSDESDIIYGIIPPSIPNLKIFEVVWRLINGQG